MLANFHKPAGEEAQHYDGVNVVTLLDDGQSQDVGGDVVAVLKQRSHWQTQFYVSGAN